jgi:hypothetical protein
VANKIFLAKNANRFRQPRQIGPVSYIQVLHALCGRPSFFCGSPQEFRGFATVENRFGAGTCLSMFLHEGVDLCISIGHAVARFEKFDV